MPCHQFYSQFAAIYLLHFLLCCSFVRSPPKKPSLAPLCYSYCPPYCLQYPETTIPYWQRSCNLDERLKFQSICVCIPWSLYRDRWRMSWSMFQWRILSFFLLIWGDHCENIRRWWSVPVRLWVRFVRERPWESHRLRWSHFRGDGGMERPRWGCET